MSTGLDIKNLPAFVQERLRLPISRGGGGLRSAHDRRYAQYIGGLTQCLPDFLDRSDTRGNTIEGRLNWPSVREVLGENSFSFPAESPLSTLLMKMPNSNLVRGLRYAWTQLNNNVQGAGGSIDELKGKRCLLGVDEDTMGFYNDGTQPESVTNQLTMELESFRAKKAAGEAKKMDKNDPTRWAFEGQKQGRAEWLYGPIDDIGYIPNDLYPSIWAQHLGVPDPAFAGFEDFYYGTKGEKVDAYGNNLAAAALPGKGFKRFHNDLQYLLSQLMETGGMVTDREAENFLANKVPEPYLRRYNKHLCKTKAKGNGRKAEGAITPDIMTYNYPVGEGGGNDSGAQSNTLPAIFEVKTFFPVPSRVGFSTNDTYNPADRRAKQVRSDYKKRLKQLDHRFALDSEEVRNGMQGPFSKAQDRFYTKGVVPLVAGPYGLMNEDLRKCIDKWAECAAASEVGREVSPLTITDRKGGALSIMRQQFRRAVSTKMVRGMAEHKLSRMHYLRATKEAARHAVQCNRSNHRHKPSEGRTTRWYKRNTHEGYGSFQQFKNGHYFHVA